MKRPPNLALNPKFFGIKTTLMEDRELDDLEAKKMIDSRAKGEGF